MAEKIRALTEEERANYIDALTSELPMLRAKAGISQDELAGFIGVSRQTYGSLERRERTMGWNSYLSLIFYFDNNSITRQIIRSTNAFPYKYIEKLCGEPDVPDKMISSLSNEYGEIFDRLDDQAFHSIRTLIMIEYARCTNQSGEAVVKSFDGMNFMKSPARPAVSDAIRKIREKRNGK